MNQFSSVQSLSRVRLFATPWIAACQASLSITTPRAYLTLIHRVSDAIQLSHPLSSPSSPAFNLSQHQGLFQWVNSLHEVAKILEFQLQHHSLQRNPRADLLQNGLVGSPCSPRDSQESSPTPQCNCRVRQLEKARFRKRTLQEQITFNEARRGSTQISELLP